MRKKRTNPAFHTEKISKKAAALSFEIPEEEEEGRLTEIAGEIKNISQTYREKITRMRKYGQEAMEAKTNEALEKLEKLEIEAKDIYLKTKQISELNKSLSTEYNYLKAKLHKVLNAAEELTGGPYFDSNLEKDRNALIDMAPITNNGNNELNEALNMAPIKYSAYLEKRNKLEAIKQQIESFEKRLNEVKVKAEQDTPRVKAMTSIMKKSDFPSDEWSKTCQNFATTSEQVPDEIKKLNAKLISPETKRIESLQAEIKSKSETLISQELEIRVPSPKHLELQNKLASLKQAIMSNVINNKKIKEIKREIEKFTGTPESRKELTKTIKAKQEELRQAKSNLELWEQKKENLLDEERILVADAVESFREVYNADSTSQSLKSLLAESALITIQSTQIYQESKKPSQDDWEKISMDAPVEEQQRRKEVLLDTRNKLEEEVGQTPARRYINRILEKFIVGKKTGNEYIQELEKVRTGKKAKGFLSFFGYKTRAELTTQMKQKKEGPNLSQP